MNDLELDEPTPQALSCEAIDFESTPQYPVQTSIAARVSTNGVRIGTLIGMTDEGSTPLVAFAGQSGKAAVQARATLDLHGLHVGRDVVLMFEDGDVDRPIIIGCLSGADGWPSADRLSQVEVDADGERLLVAAKDQLVLRCGKASITLTKAGKVLIQGTYVSNRSSGVMRIKGGSVQLN